jgi:transcriptional regulator with XRE-family HTH domain
MKDIGRRLKAKREELGLTLEQVQAETKIRRRYLEALEAGKAEPIPGEVYVRGFLRFYANFLGLDGLALVKEYGVARMAEMEEATEEAETPCGGKPGRDAPHAKVPISATGPSLKAAHGPRNGRLGRLLVYALVIVLLVAAAGVYYTWSHAQRPAGAERGSGHGSSSPLPGGTEAPGAGGAISDGEGEGKPHWALVGESDLLVSYVVYDAPFTVSLEVLAETCWIRITADGVTILEKTLGAGARAEGTAQDTLVVVLGRPQLVRVWVDGQTLGPAGTKDQPRTVAFDAGSPPGEGEGGGG